MHRIARSSVYWGLDTANHVNNSTGQKDKCDINVDMTILYTVKPLLSGPVRSGHPV